MPSDDYNPYSAPDDSIPLPERKKRRPSDDENEFEAERRPVGITVLLSIVTCGLYGAIWMLRRRDFLDGLDTSQKLGPLPTLTLGGAVVNLLLGLASGTAGPSSPVQPLSQVFGLAVGILSLVTGFRIAAILRERFAATGRDIRVSGIGVFFLQIWYLQYKINQAADTPAQIEDRPRKRRKKKKKKEEAVGTEPSTEAASGTEAPKPDETSKDKPESTQDAP